jgi:hypothetical protein
MSKFVETKYLNKKDILKFPDHYVAVAVTVDNTGILADTDGKKIVPAGTPVGGVNAPVLLDPTQKVQKKNTVAVAASLTTGVEDDNNAITWEAVTPGADGNDISIAYVNPGTPNSALDVSVAEKAITVSLATNAAAYANGTSGAEADNNGLTWTSKLVGVLGNDIVVVLENPDANSQELAISIKGHTIIISLATSEVGAITTTAADIIAAIADDDDAKALVGVDNTGDSTGAGAVTDEVIELANGSALAVTSTAADVIAAVAIDAEASLLVSGSNTGESTGLGVIAPKAATKLAGGSDAASAAEGLLLNDVDVTYGSAPGAMLIHGFVDIGKLPEDPTAGVIAALKQITFIA